MQAASVKIDPSLRADAAATTAVNHDNSIPTTASNPTSRPPLIPRPASQSPGSAVSLSNVYIEPTPVAPAGPAIDPELQIHPTLRSPVFAPPANMMPSAVQPPSDHPGTVAGPAPMQTGAPVAPAPAPAPVVADQGAEARKQKRELSQSKRAAQNRAAQRAFRQRKEGYIKKLEQQVRDYGEMERAFKALQNDNFAMREYIVNLQSRLMDSGIEFPQPPPNINLTHANATPAPLPPQSPAAPEPPAPNTGSASGASLDAVAQAVQNLRGTEPMATDSYPKTEPTTTEDDRTAEEITRQLQQADGLPAANM